MLASTPGLSGLVTTAEAARLLSVTTSAIRQRVRRNRLSVLYVGSVMLVSLADLMASYRSYQQPPQHGPQEFQ